MRGTTHRLQATHAMLTHDSRYYVQPPRPCMQFVAKRVHAIPFMFRQVREHDPQQVWGQTVDERLLLVSAHRGAM